MAQIFLFILLPTILIGLGLPIFLVLTAAGIVGLLIADAPSGVLQTSMLGSLDNVPLLAVPFFILAGDIMGRGGIATRLVQWILSIVGSMRSALPVTAVVSSEVFGSMSGSSVGCVAAIGRLLYPSLIKEGYGERFSSGLLSCSGAIAAVIPPSIAMILYGVVAQQSIPKLFAAGIVPGILIGISLLTYIVISARFKPRLANAGVAPRPRPNWRQIATSTREAIWVLIAPVVILGSIYGGIATPTEAAGLAVIYAIVVSIFVTKDLTVREAWKLIEESSFLIVQLLAILAAVGAYAWLLTTSGAAQGLISLVGDGQVSKPVLLLLVNVVLLIIGSVLEPPAAILLLTPVILPVMMAEGVDPIHLGIIVTVNLAAGMSLPPFGLNLFAAHALFGVSLPTVYRGVLPFLAITLSVLVLIVFVPEITLLPLKYLGF